MPRGWPLLLALVLALAGCHADAPPRSPSPARPGSGGRGPAQTGGTGGAAAITGTGGADAGEGIDLVVAAPHAAADGAADGATDVPEVPDPVGRPSTPVRMMPWHAEPIGGTRLACTEAVDGVGDPAQWCGFFSATADGKTELWVANVSKLGDGGAACDRGKPDAPDCRRLTANLAMVAGQRMGPDLDDMRYAHQFQGRTLLYYSDQISTAKDDAFVAPAYVWQPGWAAPKQLSPIANQCLLASSGATVNCIENVVFKTTIDGDVLGGRVADGRVKKLVRLKLFADDGNIAQSGFLFSDDGTHAVYSGIEAAEPETLWAMKVEDIGVRSKYLRVGVGVAYWWISGDSKRWYYMKGHNGDGSNPSGTLYRSDFPTGNEVVLATNVGDFAGVNTPAGRDRGVVFRQNVKGDRGTLMFIRDATLPPTGDNLIELAQGAASNWYLSPDARFVRFSQNVTEDATMDAFIGKVGSPGACAISMEVKAADWSREPFQPQGKVVLWGGNADTMTGDVEGWYAEPDGCKNPRKFADKLRWWRILGDRGLLYAAGAAGAPHQLIYARLDASATWPSTAVTIASDVLQNAFAVANGGEAVVYTLAQTKPATDGVWVSKLPPLR